MPDYDSRIVDLYDEDNPAGADHEYYRDLANRIDARSILDIGCGTGILTVTFAGPTRTVVGVDPSGTMIDHARRRPGAAQVNWIQGVTGDVTDSSFDLIVMTGNVAQHIKNPEWSRTLADVRARANDGAILAFESRNPATLAWESWVQSEPTQRETQHGPLQEWYEVNEQGDGQVLLRAHNLFVNTGDHVIQEELLTFRDRSTITADLDQAGFEVASVWCDWNQTPFEGQEPIMVFEALAI